MLCAKIYIYWQQSVLFEPGISNLKRFDSQKSYSVFVKSKHDSYYITNSWKYEILKNR